MAARARGTLGARARRGGGSWWIVCRRTEEAGAEKGGWPPRRSYKTTPPLDWAPGGAEEGGLPAQEFIQHDAQAVLVAGRQDSGLAPPGLFGGHVGRSTEDRPGGSRDLARIGPVGDPEVHEMGAALGIEADVGRLDV